MSNRDERLNENERVLALIDEAGTVVYRFTNFTGGANGVINDNFNGAPIVVFGNESKNFMAAFDANLEGQTLRFSAINVNNSTIVALDDTGSEWTVFGEAVSGPHTGKKLNSLQPSFMAYWFSIGTFYEGAEIK